LTTEQCTTGDHVSKGPDRDDRIRYRRVSARTWNDDAFRALSRPEPSAQVLWLWLLTGPCTTPVPGIVLAGLGTMSDHLGWRYEATRRCWQEIAGAGMAEGDWTNSLTWLPNAVYHNPPESPNVVTGWRKFLNEFVPECDLRWRAERAIQGYLQGLVQKGNSEGFLKAFLKGFPEACATPFPEAGGRSFRDPVISDQKYVPPVPPSLAGGGSLRPMTRAERRQAEEALDAWRRDHAPWAESAIASHQRACEREGKAVLPADDAFYAGGPTCWHEPACADEDLCIGRIVAERRQRQAAGMALVVSK
jgi:hypothetical protein